MWIRTERDEKTLPDWAPTGMQRQQRLPCGLIASSRGLPAFPPPDELWHDAGDGWQISLEVDELPPRRQTRADPDGMTRCRLSDYTWCTVAPVIDLYGRPWHVPLVRRPDGTVLLEQRFTIGDDGLPTRQATPLQERLLRAAEYFHFLADQYLQTDGGSIECDIMSGAELLAAGCHCSAQGLLAAGLLDDHLITRTWLATIGRSLAEQDAADAGVA